MILPYGPVPLTAGIVTSQDVDSSAAWVVVENVSLFLYLGVSFWPSKPPAVKVFNGQPWNVVIQPGGTLLIQCPANGWLGRIWLLGVDASGQSAAVGTVSTYSSALLRTYGPDDTPSGSPSVIRGLDILSQQRVVSVPMANDTTATTLSASGTLPGAAPGTFTIVNLNLSGSNILGSAFYYLGGFFFQCDSAAAGKANFTLKVCLKDGGGVILGGSTRTLFSFNCFTSAGVAPNEPYKETLLPPWMGFYDVAGGWPTANFLSLLVTMNTAAAALLGQNFECHANFMLDYVNADGAGHYGWSSSPNPSSGTPKF